MSNFPRRSPRFQTQPQSPQVSFSTTPSFASLSSQASSVTSTSHPSPTNDPISPEQPQHFPLQTGFLAPAQFSVPLPSPSATDINPFNAQYNMGGTQNQASSGSYQNHTAQPSNQNQHHNSFSQPQRPNYPPTSVNGVPPGLPADFLAEAAKRAQMACLMRDLGDVSL